MPLGLSQCRNLEILHLGKKEVEVEVEVKEIKDIDEHRKWEKHLNGRR